MAGEGDLRLDVAAELAVTVTAPLPDGRPQRVEDGPRCGGMGSSRSGSEFETDAGPSTQRHSPLEEEELP